MHRSRDRTRSGANGLYVAAADALFVAMTTPPTEARKALINSLIVSLQTNGIWSKLDAVYVLAAHNSQAGKLNWRTPGTKTLTEFGSGTWTTDRGWIGDGSTGYLDAGFAPSTSTQYVRDANTIFAWSRTAALSATPPFGLVANATVQLTPRITGDFFSYRVGATGGTDSANTDGTGFYAASRTGASSTQGYKAGAAFGAAGALASTAANASNFSIGRSNSTFAAVEIAAAGVGGALNATEHANLYTSLQTYMTAVGA